MITAKKLQWVLDAIEGAGISLRAVTVYSSGVGEIAIDMPQPPLSLHSWLLKRGFVVTQECDYVYRPKVRP